MPENSAAATMSIQTGNNSFCHIAIKQCDSVTSVKVLLMLSEFSKVSRNINA